MIELRKSDDRGHANHGWLQSHHTFSFGSYFDPEFRGFRTLRVVNEDRVAAGQGFGTHGHEDMEIVSYVLGGELEHKDSMGNGATLRPGEFQRITAGTGITHSEFNPSVQNPTHFYQIWIRPEQKGLEPGYEQKEFDSAGRHNSWQLVASRDGAQESLTIHQDCRIFLADLDRGQALEYAIPPGRHVWLQVLRGSILLNELYLEAGDGVAISEEASLIVKAETSESDDQQAESNAELMMFDLA